MATALVNLSKDTVAQTMRRARSKGHINTYNITGDYVTQCLEIRRTIVEFWFRSHIELGLVQAGNRRVAIESFQVRQMGADITPVRIIAGLEVMLAAGDGGADAIAEYFVQQTPGEAKGFCSDKMLQNWNLYKKRTPHERDALRHLARLIDQML